MRRVMPLGAVMLTIASISWGGEIEFVEDFSLAPDRTVVLKQLIPGTEDYYYYHALHYLNTEQFEKVRELATPWHQRHGQTGRLTEIQTRLALLSYEKQPNESLNYLRQRLGLHYPHQREQLGVEPNFPIVLDPNAISRDAFFKRADGYSVDNLDAFEDSALDWLPGTGMNPNRRRQFVARVQRPDTETLVKLIAEDLNHPNSGGFGSMGIHRQLLLPQLEELLKLKGDLLNQQNFVNTYLTKLQPNVEEDWRHNRAALESYLNRLTAFANRLAPVHNSLKAHILYHRLVLGQLRGQYSKELLIEYLKLPRPVFYLSKAMQESEELKRFPCDLNANFGAALLPPIGNDEPLVRRYLEQLFIDAASTKEFEPYVNDVYLRHLFAETKILNGLGEPEQWASLLPPEKFQALKERIDIDFATTNKTQFDPDEVVTLDLNVKNVTTLIVKVFEINTRNYYSEFQREIDTDVNLDGLVANVEQTHAYNEPPLRRISRKFEFPQLNKPGVYVVDFIGNGRSSRALIRKGRLRHLVRTGPTGQIFTILDEQNKQVKDASIWLAGHEYPPAENGTITVPFSNAPGPQSIVISRGEFASLDSFHHEGEDYSLSAGIYVDRESLLKRKKSEVVIRPSLKLNGTPSSLSLLTDVKLTITSTDLDGIASSQEIPDFALFEDRESTYEFSVPPRLASISFTLTAQVKRQTTGQKVSYAASDSFSLNEIDRTEKIEDLHLMKTATGYLIELRGKTGETRASRPVNLAIKHRDFRHPLNVTLKTDPTGRIALGALTDIATVTASGPEGTSHAWTLRADAHTYSQTVHGRVGEAITLPYLPRNPGLAKPDRSELSLLELRGDVYVADRFDHLSLQSGLVVLEKLPAGDYELLLKSTGTRILVRVTAGERLGRFVVGSVRQLETPALAPLQIESIVSADGKLTIKLRNSSKFARVHVYATRYVPEYNAFDHLSRVRAAEPYMFSQSPAESVYLTGRNIGDEYRYIIDRKYANKFPGNMLERPSLLLNPWAVRETQTGEQVAQGGDRFGAAGGKPASNALRAAADEAASVAPGGHFANLDFLAETTAILVNLVPDEQGVIEIKNEALGAHQHLYVVAVDPLNTTARSIVLPEQDLRLTDLRLLSGLDPKLHFTQQKQITIVPSGQAFKLGDVTTSKYEVYDSLPRVYGLYATLNRDPKLVEFAFLMNWPSLKPEEKRTLYSKHASHELSFFLSRKDAEFFDTVIKPYLANKKDQTFMDHYLLGHDLSSYLLPWNHEQLNVAERVLLARRLEDERPKTARHLADLYALLPPNIDRFIHLFDTSVQQSALETSDRFGTREVLERQQLMSELKATAGGVAAAPPMLAGKPGAPMDAAAKFLPEAEMARKKVSEKAKQEAPAKDGKAEAKYRRAADRDGADKNAAMDQLQQKRQEVFYEQAAGRQLRQLYRKLDPTWEWAENNYHHLTIDQQHAGLITVNAFWKDFAQHDPATPFLSRNLAEASRNFPEMLLALAVLDLPFEAAKHESRIDGTSLTLTPGNSLVVFHEEIRAVAAPAQVGGVLVSQNFFRHGDRTRQENGETIDKYVVDEFLVHTVYGCQVVITNPTSSRQKIDVLLQIPHGAIPVLNTQATRTIHLNLEPYHTQTVDYHFYFPTAGQMTHFPVHVARNETLIASAAPVTLNVVEKATKIDTGSWDYVSQHGSNDEVLAFLDKNNVNSLNLDKIAWRMNDAAMFDAVTKKLAARHVYSQTLWSYALKHNVVAAAREYLQHVDQIINECGGRLASPLLTVDLVKRRAYEHLEYKPLVNARAHALGKRRQIVNDRQYAQYHRLLRELSYERQLDDTDLLAVTYHLLLQDRLEEAQAAFTRVNVEKVTTRLQYDYCAAYLDFFTDTHAKARAIAAKYVDHPVDRWRNTFSTITAQLDEAEGKDAGGKVADAEDRNQQQAALATTEPNFDFTVEAKQINLNFQNLKQARINFYEMDVELLFSRNPFVQQFSGQFSSIKPNLSQQVTLEAEAGKAQGTKAIPLPPALHNKNVLVEIVAEGQTHSQAYYSHSLAVQVIENYGQVKVTHQATGKPVPKAYVKVYAQTGNGQVKFYKDGYTDLRGRFDYASLSTNDLDQAVKFSILILSETNGALVREATPPKQ